MATPAAITLHIIYIHFFCLWVFLVCLKDVGFVFYIYVNEDEKSLSNIYVSGIGINRLTIWRLGFHSNAI